MQHVDMTTTSQPLMPQTVYFTITFAIYSLGALIIQSTNSITSLGKLSSFIFPSVVVFELFKFFVIQKSYQLPGNLTSSVTNKTSTITNRIKDFIKSIFVFVLATLTFAFVSIILGASVLKNYEETLSLSLVLASLTILPLQMFLGTRYTMIVLLTNKIELGKLIAEQYLDFLITAAIGAILGAWAASVVMPLDWDRPWQVYPIPNVVGAFGGHLLGCAFSIMKSVLFNAKAELKKKSLL